MLIHRGFKAAEENLNEATDLKYAVDSFSHKQEKEMRVTVFQAEQSQNSSPSVLLRSVMCDILSQSSDSTNCSKCK